MKGFIEFIKEFLTPIPSIIEKEGIKVLKESDLQNGVNFSDTIFRNELKKILEGVKSVRFILLSRKITPGNYKLISSYFWNSELKTHQDIVNSLSKVELGGNILSTVYSLYSKDPNKFWSKDPESLPSGYNFIFAETLELGSNKIISQSGTLSDTTKNGIIKVFGKQGITMSELA